MSDDGMNLSRRKVLGGITTVGAASAAAGAGTFALFSSNEESDVGTVSTGTVKLGQNGGSTTTFSATNLGSDGSFNSQVQYEYTGTLEADLYLGIEFAEAGSGTDGVDDDSQKSAQDLADQFSLKETSSIGSSHGSSGHTDILTSDSGDENSSDAIASGWSDISVTTLGDLSASGALPYDGSEPTEKYGEVTNGDTVTVELDAALDLSGVANVNDFQGESLVVKLHALAEEATGN
jgi:predicted ribosomally synthesized peptide with SipW-like signal peptide